MKVGVLVIDGMSSGPVVLDLAVVPQPGSVIRDLKNKDAYKITADPAVYYPSDAKTKVDVVVFAVYGDINSFVVSLADSNFR